MVPFLKSAILGETPHGFFTRRGGVSSGVFSSLNIGYEKGDKKACVDENRRRICAVFSKDLDRLVTVKQCHSSTVVVLNRPKRVDEIIEADGIITQTPGLILGVKSADCVPILMVDEDAKIIAAVTPARVN